MKKCRKCLQVKPLNDFYTLRSSSDKKHPECKGCCKLSRAASRVKRRAKKGRLDFRQKYRAAVELNHKSKNKPVDSIQLHKVYERDKGICGICHTLVPSNKASLDHIVPLSRKGTHTWDNVQLSHVRCNKSKGDS